MLVSAEHADGAPSALRVSTFKGTQLVGPFVEPLAAGEPSSPGQGFSPLHVLEGSATIILVAAVWECCSRVVLQPAVPI